jgi:CRP-like cAMP-binding protein
MFSHFPAMTLAKKAVTVTVICGAVAVGTGGAAFATTTTSTSVTRCARAPKALTKITKVETAITRRLAKLQAQETKLTTAHHTKLAARVEKRITKLQKADTKAGALATKINAKCPSGASS